MKQLRISAEALRDLDEGYLFYETQEPGVGDYFAASLKADIEKLKLSAGSRRKVYRDYHHMVASRFPFGIYYTFDQSTDTATIWYIIDLRQDPEWIETRLTSY